jgi:hypothetical protein
MNWQSDVINEALVCDGYEFIDHNARARYIREDRAKRPQWLNDNHCKWRRLSDVLGRAAQRASSDDAFVKVDPNSSSSGLKPTAENVVTAAAIRWSVETASPPNATIAATLLQTIVESAVVIDGRTCITTEQFASQPTRSALPGTSANRPHSSANPAKEKSAARQRASAIYNY